MEETSDQKNEFIMIQDDKQNAKRGGDDDQKPEQNEKQQVNEDEEEEEEEEEEEDWPEEGEFKNVDAAENLIKTIMQDKALEYKFLLEIKSKNYDEAEFIAAQILAKNPNNESVLIFWDMLRKHKMEFYEMDEEEEWEDEKEEEEEENAAEEEEIDDYDYNDGEEYEDEYEVENDEDGWKTEDEYDEEDEEEEDEEEEEEEEEDEEEEYEEEEEEQEEQENSLNNEIIKKQKQQISALGLKNKQESKLKPLPQAKKDRHTKSQAVSAITKDQQSLQAHKKTSSSGTSGQQLTFNNNTNITNKAAALNLQKPGSNSNISSISGNSATKTNRPQSSSIGYINTLKPPTSRPITAIKSNQSASQVQKQMSQQLNLNLQQINLQQQQFQQASKQKAQSISSAQEIKKNYPGNNNRPFSSTTTAEKSNSRRPPSNSARTDKIQQILNNSNNNNNGNVKLPSITQLGNSKEVKKPSTLPSVKRPASKESRVNTTGSTTTIAALTTNASSNSIIQQNSAISKPAEKQPKQD